MTSIYKPLLVTGNMRCGTTWLTHVMREAGFDVMHECMGEYGSISWFFAIDHHWYPEHPNNPPRGRTAHIGEGRRSDYKFGKVVHLVRAPLKTIGSMCSIMQTVEQDWLVECGVIPPDLKPKLLRMMHAWYNINLKASEGSHVRLRLEDLVQGGLAWRTLMKTIGEDPRLLMPDLPPKNASRGIFEAKKITWKDMSKLDMRLAGSIMNLSHKYGYDV